MEVKLVSITKSLVTEKDLNPEELIVYIARVSNPSNQLNSETSDKLISYLIKNKHWSPMEMVDMTIEIVTSRAIAQQILRHRSFSFQEFSQRYAEVTEFENVQIREQSIKNRQSSEYKPEFEKLDGVEYVEDWTSKKYTGNASSLISSHITTSENLYKALIKSGVAKECARMVLPLTTQTKIYMKGSIRSWIHYLQIRCDEHCQLEHREIANWIREIFNDNFPNISKALSL